MGFHEVEFPMDPEYASGFAPGFRNTFTELRSGAVETAVHNERPRRSFDLRGQVQSYDDAEALYTFWTARTGGANGFRIRDWTDYTTAANRRGTPGAADRLLGVGDDVTTVFALRTSYVSGGVTKWRPLTKPVAGTVRVSVGGVELVEGVDWTVNTATGLVTFTTAPALGDDVEAGCEFHVPVRFAPETDAKLGQVINAYDLESIERIMVFEDLAPSPLDDERHFGGGRAFGAVSANFSLAVADGAAISVNPSVAGIEMTLPATGTLAAVGPDFFRVFNDSFLYSITVKDAGGATVASLGPRSSANLGVYVVDASDTLAWRAS